MSKFTELRLHPYFIELIDEAKRSRPVVPKFDFRAAQQSVEEIKAKSSEQAGFDLCLSIITGKNVS